MTTYTGTLPTAADGQKIFGADITQLISALHALNDAWTDFSGSVGWTSAGTAPAIGNGTIVAKYVQLGKLVIYSGIITMGSSTTYGSPNSWLVSLPVATYAGAPGVGVSHMNLFGTASSSRGGDVIFSGLTQLLFFAGSGGPATNTTPFTWTSGSSLRWTIVYEAA